MSLREAAETSSASPWTRPRATLVVILVAAVAVGGIVEAAPSSSYHIDTFCQRSHHLSHRGHGESSYMYVSINLDIHLICWGTNYTMNHLNEVRI